MKLTGGKGAMTQSWWLLQLALISHCVSTTEGIDCVLLLTGGHYDQNANCTPRLLCTDPPKMPSEPGRSGKNKQKLAH